MIIIGGGPAGLSAGLYAAPCAAGCCSTRANGLWRSAIPGAFAAGDVRSKALYQIVTAVGGSATAAFNAGRFIEENF